MGKLTISMAIFNSYVKLPEGRSNPFQLAFVLRYLMAGAGGSFVEDKKTPPNPSVQWAVALLLGVPRVLS